MKRRVNLVKDEGIKLKKNPKGEDKVTGGEGINRSDHLTRGGERIQIEVYQGGH